MNKKFSQIMEGDIVLLPQGFESAGSTVLSGCDAYKTDDGIEFFAAHREKTPNYFFTALEDLEVETI